MRGDFWRAQTPEQLENCFRFLRQNLPEVGLRISWEPWRDRRSLNANALYWQWLTVMAEYFSRKGNKFTKDDMHDLMRHQFLGYEDRAVGSTVISRQLASTSNLDVGQMCHYMTKIDAWAADHRCLLPHPEDSEYSRYREAQIA